jgi:hypothetical protein
MAGAGKGDDIMSEGGYGKRTLLAPEGAIALNDKDTVIAGTKLYGSNNNVERQPEKSLQNEETFNILNDIKNLIGNMNKQPISNTIELDSQKVASITNLRTFKIQ